MKLGIDLIYIPEFKQKLKQQAILEKLFTDTELKENPRTESLAGIFAAKEAFFKALGEKIGWLDVWVEKTKTGQPQMRTNQKINKISVSISHSGDYATAMVGINE